MMKPPKLTLKNFSKLKKKLKRECHMKIVEKQEWSEKLKKLKRRNMTNSLKDEILELGINLFQCQKHIYPRRRTWMIMFLQYLHMNHFDTVFLLFQLEYKDDFERL